MEEDPLIVQFLFDRDVGEHLEICKECQSIKNGIEQQSERDNIGKVDIGGFVRYLSRPRNLDGIKMVLKHARLLEI